MTSAVGAPARDRYRWTVLALGVGAQGALAAIHQGLPALAPELGRRYGLSLAELGVTMGALAAGTMATALPWGALADRVGERLVMASGLVASAGGLAAAAFAPGALVLNLLMFAVGMAAGSATSASGRAVVGWFGPSERGFALGVRHMATPAAGAAAAVALPLAVTLGGLRAAFLLLATTSLAVAVAIALWLRAPRREAADTLRHDSSPFRDRRIWTLATGAGLVVIAQSALTAFVVLFLHDERGWSLGAAAGVLATIQILGAIGRVAAGRVSDLMGRRLAPLRAIMLAAAVTIGCAAALEGTPDGVLVPVLVLASVLAMSGNPLTQAATAEMAGRARAGTALGLQNTLLFGAAAIGPAAFGVLVAGTSWRAGFAALSLVALAGGACVCAIRDDL